MSNDTHTGDLTTQIGELEQRPRSAVSFRAVMIACGLIPLMAMWVVQAELIWYSGHSTAISLFYHVTFTILVIALVNLLVRRVWPRAALTAGELLTIYVMLSVAGTLCSHDMMQIMIPMLGYPAQHANPQNRWAEVILQHIPKWAIVTDKEACEGLSVGNATIYNWKIFKAWVIPLAFWGLFLMALMTALLCVTMIFRQPWTEKERLSFPIIQIPLIISTGLSKLLRSRLFWIGFALAASIDIVNGFNVLDPRVPKIPIIAVFRFNEYFVERPWNAIAGTHVSLYPFVIGLAFFLPTDLAFSCWFFFVFFRLQMVLAAALGVTELPGFPFPGEQAAGGYIALGLWAIWLARWHLIGVERTVLGRPGGLDESREPMRYRTSLGLLLASCIILGVCGVSLGGSVWVIVAFFVIFLIYSLAISRRRAELGPPAHDLHAMGPGVLLTNVVGSKDIGTGNIGMISSFFWFNRAYRAHFSPHSMEGLKIAQQTRITARSMVVAIFIALWVGLISAYWATLHAVYVHGYSGRGAAHAFAREGWARMEQWVNFPKGTRTAASIATGVGIVFTLFLGIMRTKATWWLWHPVGYATATSWSMWMLWAPIFIAWLIKAIITRYGGAKAYRIAIPFFVGLVLGEFVIGSFWTIYGAIVGVRTYQFWG